MATRDAVLDLDGGHATRDGRRAETPGPANRRLTRYAEVTRPGRGQAFATEPRGPRMHRRRIIGLLATGVGLAGYGAGTVVAYPGRAFSLTVGMVGIALAALGREPQ